MNGRRSVSIVRLTLLAVAAMAGRVAGENTATNPQPPDGAVAAAEGSGTNLYMVLDYSPRGGVVSHTGYFSDKYADVAGRDAAHCLGSPPYPAISRTAYFVGLNASEIPAFARAPLERGKTYYWAVDEFDGTMIWPGEVWTFTVMTVEAWNPNPRDGARYVVAEGDTTLSWSQGDVETTGWRVGYRIYYGTDRGIVEAATTANVSTAIERCTVSGLLSGAEYFWRVDTMLVQVTPPFGSRTTRGKVWRFETFGGMPVIYVDADAKGANNGSSWANAYRFLQDALTDANTAPKPAEIRVAQGTYRPDEDTAHPNGTADRDATFRLINGVAIEGGYAGFGEPYPDARDINKYKTVLSGDLDDDDAEIGDWFDVFEDPTRMENSFHVVTGTNTDKAAVLDGCTVSSANANGDTEMRDAGGGIYIETGSPAIKNCTFTHNSAGFGGGMLNYYDCSTNMEGCTFSANVAYFGGGIFNIGCSPTLNGCTFTGNSGQFGGGMCNGGDCSPILKDCTFIANSADFGAGGAMYNDGPDSPMLMGCTFAANSAIMGNGGGMYNGKHCSPMLKACTLNGNSAEYGGGMYNAGSNLLTVEDSTFSGNSAGASGSTTYCANAGVTFTDCILWNNKALDGHEIYLWDGPGADTIGSVSYTDIQGGRASVYASPGAVFNWGSGNIDGDPCFVEPGHWDANGVWIDGDYHLRLDSPCVNAGDPNFVAEPNETDMDGELRVMLRRVDMGADEFNPFAAQFVVVRKERVERTVFEYECEVVLENISRFAVRNVSLGMVKAPANMVLIEPNVTFGSAEIGPGKSAKSLDTCTFTVDRAAAIDPAGIIWRATAELADTGAKMEHTLTSLLALDPPRSTAADFEGLAALADNWLWVGTPGGIEEDTVPDGTVNLADFAEFAQQWKTNP